MAYIEIETAATRHRKQMKAGPAACWLWVCGLAYCQETLSDGFIPEDAIDFLGVKQPRKLVAVLVTQKLWHAVEGGWRVHDYLDYNKSADEVRKIQVERRRAGSHGGRRSWEHRQQHAPKANAEADAEANALASAEANAEATAEGLAEPASLRFASPRFAPPRHGVRDASDAPGPHRSHAACGRVCVPRFLHEEFVRRRNRPNADAELRAFYGTVLETWGGQGPKAGEEPGDAVTFWRARYDEHWPPAKGRPPIGQAPTYAEWTCPHRVLCTSRGDCAMRVRFGPERYPVLRPGEVRETAAS